MRKVLVTGFPGFLAGLLVRELAPRADSLVLLVEERFLETARQKALQIAGVFGLPAERFDLVVGDITRPGLGLAAGAQAELAAEVDTVFHLAAIYDLAVPEAAARRVNVTGTANVGRFLAGLERLERYNYISTFAVAGRRTGVVRENELEHDAGFHNHYESTKYEAEVLVRRDAARGVPTTILRPGVVVGSSKDGRTTKYDGPYMVLKMMRDLPGPLGRLNLGSTDVPFQMVPADFVIGAMARLGTMPEAVGKTFHLTDPDPRTTAEIFELFSHAMFGRGCLAGVPSPLTRLVTASGATQLLGVQKEAGPYFFHRCRYDCVNTLDALDGTGVHCPPLESYADRLVRYFVENPVPRG